MVVAVVTAIVTFAVSIVGPALLPGYVASAVSSKANYADNRPPVKIRFWAYGADSVIGDVRYAEGGYAGRFAWARVGEVAGVGVGDRAIEGSRSVDAGVGQVDHVVVRAAV